MFPMIRRVLMLGATLGALAGAAGAETTGTRGEPSNPALQTQEDMARVGRVLLDFSWARPEQFVEHCIWAGFPFDRESVPVISHAELEALLVPTHLETLPEFDAWGNAYEFRIDERFLPPGGKGFEPLDSLSDVVMSSPGADGVFEGTIYPGRYTSNPDDDLIWVDGIFVQRLPVDPQDFEAQMDEAMDILGKSFRSWHLDQVGSREPLPQSPAVAVRAEDRISYADVVDNLNPVSFFYYTRCIPEFDPWGNPYEVYVHGNLLDDPVMLIRAAGSDGVFEGDTYDRRVVTAPEEDRVWSDGVHFRGIPILFTDGFESGDLLRWTVVDE